MDKKQIIIELLQKSLFIKQDKVDAILAGIKKGIFDDKKLDQIIQVLQSSMDKQHTVVKRLVREKPWALRGLHKYVHKDKLEVVHEDEEIDRRHDDEILVEIYKELEAL